MKLSDAQKRHLRSLAHHLKPVVRVGQHGWQVGLVLLFLVVITLAGWQAPRLLGFSRADSTAIEMELVVRNVNLGVLLKASIFPVLAGGDNTLGDMVLFSVLLYGAAQLLAAAVLIPLRRRSAADRDPGR